MTGDYATLEAIMAIGTELDEVLAITDTQERTRGAIRLHLRIDKISADLQGCDPMEVAEEMAELVRVMDKLLDGLFPERLKA